MNIVDQELEDKLSTTLAAIDDDLRQRLREQLAIRGEVQGLVDIAYRTIDTPVGPLLLAATEQGLVRVAYAREGHDHVLSTLADRVSPRILKSPRRLDRAARELDDYFEGRRAVFDLQLDFRLSHGFRRDVLGCLTRIPFGETRAYAQVASEAGNARAVRAAATACATNPLPIIVPCHRVIRSDGSVGSYVGGLEAKQLLLSLERRTSS